MAYLGKEGYQINLELREDKQHCQNGTPEFLQETLWFAKRKKGKHPKRGQAKSKVVKLSFPDCGGLSPKSKKGKG